MVFPVAFIDYLALGLHEREAREQQQCREEDKREEYRNFAFVFLDVIFRNEDKRIHFLPPHISKEFTKCGVAVLVRAVIRSNSDLVADHAVP